MNKPIETFQMSEAELTAMTVDLDQMHYDISVPAMNAAVAEMTENAKAAEPVRKNNSRRTFLLGASGVAVSAAGMGLFAGTPALAAAATSQKLATGAKLASSSKLTGDLAIAGLAASLENLGVYAYNAGITAATAGKLGTVPPAVVTLAETAKAQHTAHAAAWNSVLTANGKSAVTDTDPALTPTVNTKFGMVKTVADLAELALLIENIAAQTYQATATLLKSTAAIKLMCSIQPVEMQHAAILYFALGMYPGIQTASGTPLAFNPTALAQ